MNEKAKELGVDGPLVTKYYGDTQREAAMKYKKGVSWAKRWKNLSALLVSLSLCSWTVRQWVTWHRTLQTRQLSPGTSRTGL